MSRSVPILLFVVAASAGLWLSLSTPERPGTTPISAGGSPAPVPSEIEVTPETRLVMALPVAAAGPPQGSPEGSAAPEETRKREPEESADEGPDQTRGQPPAHTLRRTLAPEVASVAGVYDALIGAGAHQLKKGVACDELAKRWEETLGDGHGALELIHIRREELEPRERQEFDGLLDARYRGLLQQLDRTVDRLGPHCEDSPAFARAAQAASEARLGY